MFTIASITKIWLSTPTKKEVDDKCNSISKAIAEHKKDDVVVRSTINQSIKEFTAQLNNLALQLQEKDAGIHRRIDKVVESVGKVDTSVSNLKGYLDGVKNGHSR